MSAQTLVVVGAGQATSELVMAARHEGYAGRILVIGAEPHLPYQRPPLSKAYLAGTATLDSLLLRSPAAYEKAQVEFLLGTRVEGIDRQKRRVLLDDGRDIQYDQLALNLGGRARRLEIPGLEARSQPDNLHYVRAIGDIDRLRTQLQPGARLVIIGGGYIGLEVAAVAIKLGLDVTVLEALPRVLARVTAPELSSFYQRLHTDAGVRIRTGVEVQGFELDPSATRIAAIVCGDGSRVPADAVIAGIGLIPNTELAAAAGLAVDNGIVVDEFARTSDPFIVAAGDCTNHVNTFYDCRIRLESVPNAIEQARAAAASLCGKQRACSSVPWFWSDQYNLKLQMTGLSRGYDQLVLRGSCDQPSFAAFYLKEGRIIAADAVHRPQEFMLAKRLVAERAVIDPQRLADESVSAKELLQQWQDEVKTRPHPGA
jgi:3-phenylpropionate/trans-cinnamate dioxygenase ferredoxin reductase component